MKKFSLIPLLLLALPILSTVLFSFNSVKGGDFFEIYLNGSRVHQQFVHADKSTKAIRLSSFGDNDKFEVFYSHCGVTGKNRVIAVRNEKNELLKEIKFADAATKRSLMGFTRKDIGKLKGTKMNLYYSAKELPEGKLLATVSWDAGQNLAKR